MITLGDAARVLAKCSAYDQRTIGEADVAAWAEALNLANPPITAADALAAVAHWHAETTEDRRIRPAHVIQVAQQLAKRRAGAARRQQLDEQEALNAAETTDHSSDVVELVDALARKMGTGDPTVLRRREWVEWERKQQRAARAAAEPNPGFRRFPPPGGWPMPGEGETA